MDYIVSPSPSPFPLDFGFRIWDLDLGLDLGLTIIIEGHSRSWRIIESKGRSRKVKEGHGWSFPFTGLTFQVRKVMGGVGGGGK